MASNPTGTLNGTAIVQLTQNDMQDPQLFQLNTRFNQIYQLLTGVYGPGMQTTLGATLTLPNALASAQTSVPTDPNTLITLGTAQTLFSAATQREALATGSAANIEEVVQPISGAGTGVPGPPGPPGSINGIIANPAS